VAPEAPDWAAGYTQTGSRVLYLRLGALGVYPHSDLLSIFAHELAHAELGELAGRAALPRWFDEGACMVLARPWDLRDSVSLTLALFFHAPEPLARLEAEFPPDESAARSAYAQSFSFVSWLAEEHGGPEALAAVARDVGQGRPFDVAFTRRIGRTPLEAERAWGRSVARWYRLVPVITGTTALWSALSVMFILVLIRNRRRIRERLSAWETEEDEPAGNDTSPGERSPPPPPAQ
jgi:peptidase MA superfamily protein